MQTLVLDANFLMSAYKFRVDAISELKGLVVGEFRLVAPSSVLDELELISRTRGAAGPQAKYALEVMRKEGVTVMRTKKKADEWIEDFCSSTGAIACTNDSDLRKKLKEKGVRCILLKGKSKLGYA